MLYRLQYQSFTTHNSSTQNGWLSSIFALRINRLRTVTTVIYYPNLVVQKLSACITYFNKTEVNIVYICHYFNIYFFTCACVSIYFILMYQLKDERTTTQKTVINWSPYNKRGQPFCTIMYPHTHLVNFSTWYGIIVIIQAAALYYVYHQKSRSKPVK